MKKLLYSKKTQELLNRMCRNVEREDFILDKKVSEELILKTYDLFSLDRPKNTAWFVDVTDKEFLEMASSARLARLASSASSASLARLALDYDFDWFIFCYEYKQANKEKINENDEKYLAYCEILMSAKEAGLGYRIEYEDTLYLVPTPLVKIDSENRFHYEKGPAILWKSGSKFYFIHGVKVTEKIVMHPEMLIKQDWLDETNTEVRRIIQDKMGSRFTTEVGGKVIAKYKDIRIGEIVEIDISPDPEKVARYLHAQDWSSKRMYFLRIPPKISDPMEAQAWTYDMELYLPEEVLRT